MKLWHTCENQGGSNYEFSARINPVQTVSRSVKTYIWSDLVKKYRRDCSDHYFYTPWCVFCVGKDIFGQQPRLTNFECAHTPALFCVCPAREWAFGSHDHRVSPISLLRERVCLYIMYVWIHVSEAPPNSPCSHQHSFKLAGERVSK